LRLVFHDAGTFSFPPGNGGLNASIQYELDRPENAGLKRGWRIIEQVRVCMFVCGVATDADLVALAGAYAVRLCGGPDIALALGRPVAAAASPDPPDRMPGENFTAEQLKANFAAKGLSVQEMVALSGAHTLGSKGFGDPTRFDNEYYRALLRRPWTNPNDSMASMIGLPSDHVLPDDPECLPYIERYAEDQDAFFADFAAAYVKLTSLGVPGWAV
ncbi:L-ascorbate peroxidase, partial [Volvox carteri f. nagariensis]